MFLLYFPFPLPRPTLCRSSVTNCSLVGMVRGPPPVHPGHVPRYTVTGGLLYFKSKLLFFFHPPKYRVVCVPAFVSLGILHFSLHSFNTSLDLSSDLLSTLLGMRCAVFTHFFFLCYQALTNINGKRRMVRARFSVLFFPLTSLTFISEKTQTFLRCDKRKGVFFVSFNCHILKSFSILKLLSKGSGRLTSRPCVLQKASANIEYSTLLAPSGFLGDCRHNKKRQLTLPKGKNGVNKQQKLPSIFFFPLFRFWFVWMTSRERLRVTLPKKNLFLFSFSSFFFY